MSDWFDEVNNKREKTNFYQQIQESEEYNQTLPKELLQDSGLLELTIATQELNIPDEQGESFQQTISQATNSLSATENKNSCKKIRERQIVEGVKD
ncbi:9195_t:CDS:2 [Cetraspora pellucida]|uniref:9195_t:CDS:1 n=1 Tax=Cetraspora pellucida TaxID=1433469 RepID=A0ACA9KNA0_9GLOM|nr:9195_t:CDS:2 [Cetraspora pellucida]